MSQDREEIPEPLKRLVRQQCSFGCAICGMPVFEYDHIIPYSKVKKHEFENLILLCPNHHNAKGKHLDEERIREAWKNPYNKGKDVITGYRLEPNHRLEITVGSNKINHQFEHGNGIYHCLWINDISFFSIHSDENWLTFSFIITDTIGQVILSVEEGEIKFSGRVWDYNYEGSRLQIRTGKGEILLDLNLSNYKVEILRGFFIHYPHRDGFCVEKNGKVLTIGNNKAIACRVGGDYSNNGFGGLGIWNKSKYPSIIKPNGFGSINII